MKNININRILLCIIAALLIFIIAASAIALCTKNARPGAGLRKEDPEPKSVSSSKTAFNEIGHMTGRTLHFTRNLTANTSSSRFCSQNIFKAIQRLSF